MILIGITLLLLIALGINHAVCGPGYWGLQPGGLLSANLYALQMLTALVGVLLLFISLARRSIPVDPRRLVAIAVFAALSVFTYGTFGWRAYTSIHHQGIENLLAFLCVSATTYLIGRYRQLRPTQSAERAEPTALQDETSSTEPLVPSDNPYESPRTGPTRR